MMFLFFSFPPDANRAILWGQHLHQISNFAFSEFHHLSLKSFIVLDNGKEKDILFCPECQFFLNHNFYITPSYPFQRLISPSNLDIRPQYSL